MASYINVHKMVNNRRLEAQQRAEEGEAVVGPRVIVVGPTDAGKSTLCRLLINYAVRSGFEPTFVDLDVGEGQEGCGGACRACWCLPQRCMPSSIVATVCTPHDCSSCLPSVC